MRVSIKLANPNDRADPITVESALVDTGATLTTIPRAIADRLALDIIGKVRANAASGPIDMDESFAYFDYQGRKTVTPVWISDEYPGVLIGVITLEALGLAVDPKSGTLVNSELLLL